MSDEDLIKYAWPQDIWFHVDKLSSAHVYLRMPSGMDWESIPEALLTDCAQLVKANSIEGVLPSIMCVTGMVNRSRWQETRRIICQSYTLQQTISRFAIGILSYNNALLNYN